MPTLRQLSYIGTATALTSLVALVAGCGPTPSPDGGTDLGAGGGSGGALVGAGGTGSPGVGGTGGDIPVGPCQPGIPVTSQIPRLLNRQYDNIVRELLGVEALANGQPPSSLLNADEPGPMNPIIWRAYLNAGETIAAQVMSGQIGDKSKFINCSPATAGCLTETIKTFGRKAFRRPLTEVANASGDLSEVARFEALANTTPPGTPDEVAETTLLAFLVSPSFLQVTELANTPEGAGIKLSSHEVAMRLSLALWGSVPDGILNVAADQDQLQTKEQILEQAKRMLEDRPRASAQLVALHRHYARLDDDLSHWFKVRPNPAKYPLYSPALDATLKAELDAFFEEVVFSKGSFKDLLLSNVAFVTKDTAPIYGLDPAGFGETLKLTNLDAQTRPGFLTRAGFLSSYAHAEATSPILRGAYLAVDIIAATVGAPDPDNLKTPPPPGEFATEREYVTELTKPNDCKGCHLLAVNPPGFAFENYDAVGAWQTQDPRGGAIDPVVQMPLGSNEIRTFSNAKELLEGIAQTPSARRHYAEKLVAAATGRLPNAYDTCIVDDLDANLTVDGYSIIDLFAEITQADSFRLRARGN